MNFRKPRSPEDALKRRRLGKRLRQDRKKDWQSLRYGGSPSDLWSVRRTPLRAIESDFRAKFSSIVQNLQMCAGTRQIRVLDLGCLDGEAISQLAADFPNIKAHGLSLKRLDSWKKYRTVAFRVAHAEKTRFPANHFDLIYSYFGLTHSDFESSVKEAHRILLSGGELLVNQEVGNLYGLRGSDFDLLNQQKKRLEELGFEVLKGAFLGIGVGNQLICKFFHLRKK